MHRYCDIACDRGHAAMTPPGIVCALVEADRGLRVALNRQGFLARDSRIVERKEAGLKKSRKTPQRACARGAHRASLKARLRLKPCLRFVAWPMETGRLVRPPARSRR